MFQKKKSVRASARTRQPAGTVSESFRRNNVVISTRQKEIAKRQQSVTQRQAEQKKAATRRRAKTRAVTFIIAAILVAFVFRMKISNVSVESNAASRLQSDAKVKYETDIQTFINENTLLGQSWLLDTDSLSKKMIESHPEIKRVSFNSSAPASSQLRADVRFRRPVFTWRDASSTDQFVDEDGVLFGINLDPSVNAAKLIKIEDQSGVVLDSGTSVLTSTIIAFIGQLHGKLTPLYGPNSSVSRVIIPRSTREVQVQMSGQPYIIKFNSTRNLDQQIGELQALLGFLKVNNATPGTYIDLRVPHKAFYK